MRVPLLANKLDGDCFALVRAHQHGMTIHNQDVMRERESEVILFITYVTGSAKRYTNAQAMIFLYKRCCSKTRNIFYALKKKIFLGLGIYNSLPTLTPKLRN